jgi:hypothetical protein
MHYCERTKRERYWNPHRECDAIRRLAHDRKIVDVASRYLGSEPILWLTQLRWSGPLATRRQLCPSAHEEPRLYDVNAFHYDALDCKSLTVFVYLTDVSHAAGPHVVVEGTHARKTLADICTPVLSDAAAQRKFGDRIRMLLGGRGTMIFEDTSAFHKAAPCATERLLLSIDYVLRRPPPPERPVVSYVAP